MIYTEAFFAQGSTFPNDDEVNLIDSYTFEPVIYKKTNTGVPATGNGDGAVYRKKGNDFYKRQWTGYVNVLWWGIQGLSDQLTAERLNTILQLGYDTFFGKISLEISGALFLQSNQRLLSDQCKIKQNKKNTEIFNCTAKKNISIKGFFLEGLKTDYDYDLASSSKAVGIYCYGAQNIRIEKNLFKNFTYAGVSGLRNMVDLTFKQNRVENEFTEDWAKIGLGKKDNAGIAVGGKNINVVQNYFKNSSQGLIIAENSAFVTISDNDIENTILEHGMYLDAGISNMTVLGNRVRNTKGIGIKLQNYDQEDYPNYVCHNIVISNNIVDNAGTVIDEALVGTLDPKKDYIPAAGDGILINNTNKEAPYQLIARNVVVTGNVVRNAKQHGINIRHVEGGVISNNVINDIGNVGLYVSHAKGVDVSHNNVQTSGENGILIESNNNLLNVSFNIVENPGTKNAANEGRLAGIKLVEGNNNEIAIRHNKIRGNGMMTWGIFSEGGAGQSTQEIENNVILNSKYSDCRFINGTTALRMLRNNYKNIENSPGEQPW
ncbi:right-handed parallel beta-helix repeat-containing protein [Chryseobacterium sp.]|uniref:right-handed parallel beta-helix repeat-containing protein n=1 Tax=Chryseobacterium sp. TaxID=1871047 RepID=UPI0025BADE2E|nr:right-handed parallel beta-helix repeat-containing protein [Chryseobacterium sp.]MBV8327981.1 right-handed parallel beta-helix repeat-containing protein [Chryseobacterium sp.]